MRSLLELKIDASQTFVVIYLVLTGHLNLLKLWAHLNMLVFSDHQFLFIYIFLIFLVCEFVAWEEIDPLSPRAAGQTAPHRAHWSV